MRCYLHVKLLKSRDWVVSSIMSSLVKYTMNIMGTHEYWLWRKAMCSDQEKNRLQGPGWKRNDENFPAVSQRWVDRDERIHFLVKPMVFLSGSRWSKVYREVKMDEGVEKVDFGWFPRELESSSPWGEPSKGIWKYGRKIEKFMHYSVSVCSPKARRTVKFWWLLCYLNIRP